MINKWSWEHSNGSASDEETIRSYNALINKSSTNKFSYKVWNDIINKIKEVINYYELNWKPEFNTYEKTLMGGSDILLAKSFDAAIDNINYAHWSWYKEPTSEGYVGKIYFDTGDLVYAKYFLQAIEVLNALIESINRNITIKEVHIKALTTISSTIMKANAIITTARLLISSDFKVNPNPDILVNLEFKHETETEFDIEALITKVLDGEVNFNTEFNITSAGLVVLVKEMFTEFETQLKIIAPPEVDRIKEMFTELETNLKMNSVSEVVDAKEIAALNNCVSEFISSFSNSQVQKIFTLCLSNLIFEATINNTNTIYPDAEICSILNFTIDFKTFTSTIDIFATIENSNALNARISQINTIDPKANIDSETELNSDVYIPDPETWLYPYRIKERTLVIPQGWHYNREEALFIE